MADVFFVIFSPTMVRSRAAEKGRKAAGVPPAGFLNRNSTLG
jgi:hypothetical protein